MKYNLHLLFMSILLLFHCIYLCRVNCRRQIDVDDLMSEMENARMKDDNGEEGRAEMEEEQLLEDRAALPSVVLKYKAPLDELDCGTLYSVWDEGYLTFKLNSTGKTCEYTFMGTRTNNCTTAISCSGKVAFKSPTEEGCDDFITLEDGMDGRMSGCGKFKFDSRPRIARNNGTDIYMTYKGVAKSLKCVVFCVQDVKDREKEPKMKKLAELRKTKYVNASLTEPSCICGKRNDKGRVVGGVNAQKFEFPWIGAVVFKGTKHSRQPFCGASLINDRYAVTAAHCFSVGITAKHIEVIFHAHLMDRRVSKGEDPDDPKFQVIPGWNSAKETDAGEKSIRVGVEKIITHPKYTKYYDYDISILKLKSRVNLKKGIVSPICLPMVSERYDYTGKSFTVAGWGRYSENLHAGSRILQKLDVNYMNLYQCRDYNRATSRHLCAGFLDGNRDSCNGDSGGPLIYKFNSTSNQYLLAGVVSAGRGCARKNSMGLYTNVQEIVQWIYYISKDGIWCPRERESKKTVS